MAPRLRDLLAIQEPQQIPKAREADQARGVQGSAGDLPRHQNLRAHPGAGSVPMLDHLRAIVLDALVRRRARASSTAGRYGRGILTRRSATLERSASATPRRANQ